MSEEVTPAQHFQPYIKPLEIGLPARFFYATDEARQWYDPIKPHARLEYEWVLANVPLRDQRVIDCGAHHGHYAVVLGAAMRGTGTLCVADALATNCAIIEANLAINRIGVAIHCCAVTNRRGIVRFLGESNGRVVDYNGVEVPGKRLVDLLDSPTVVKVDIEGEEFKVIPDSIDELPTVHSWIVEVHPSINRVAPQLMQAFQDRPFDLHWVNREAGCIEPYPADARWTTHTTVFARRK